jgi:hypothetical protein
MKKQNITLTYDGKDYVFTPPTRKILSMGITLSKKDPLKSVDVLIDNCLTDATQTEKTALKEDTGFVLFVAENSDTIYGKKEGELKKT